MIKPITVRYRSLYCLEQGAVAFIITASEWNVFKRNQLSNDNGMPVYILDFI